MSLLERRRYRRLGDPTFMPAVTLSRSSGDPLDAWLDRCQAELGTGRSDVDALTSLRALKSDLPRVFLRSQRERAQGMLTRLLCRAVARRWRSAVQLARVVELVARDFDESWREEWEAVACALFDTPAGPDGRVGPAPADVRAERALAAIEREFPNPNLQLQDVARQLALSACRLTQLLKRETGTTFGAHLHRRRVAQACALLADRTLSIKQIADRVGYRTTTQLGRQFKRHTALQPSRYRQTLCAVRADSPRPTPTATLLVMKQQNERPIAETTASLGSSLRK